jgi:hypothetical protein
MRCQAGYIVNREQFNSRRIAIGQTSGEVSEGREEEKGNASGIFVDRTTASWIGCARRESSLNVAWIPDRLLRDTAVLNRTL